MKRRTKSKPKHKWEARRQRVVGRLETSERVRLTVYRTARHIYAQLVDPVTGRTVAGSSTRVSSVAAGLGSTGGVEGAKRVGAAIAEIARERGIDNVVFNRNGFLYHGRVKALADAAREAGLRF